MELNPTHLTAAFPTSSESASTDADHLPILLIYDELSAGFAAKEAVDRIAKNLAAQPSYSIWREEHLADAATSGAVLRDLRAARLVVLASSQSSALSSRVRDWLVASRFSFNQPRTALVILREGELEARCPAKHLKGKVSAIMADIPNVNVFCHTFNAPRKRVYWAPPREPSPGERRSAFARARQSEWAQA